MAKVPTVKIVADNPQGFIKINAEDFREGDMELYDPIPEVTKNVVEESVIDTSAEEKKEIPIQRGRRKTKE